MFIRKSSTIVTSVTENTPASQVCSITSRQLMRTRSIPAQFVIIKQEIRVILQDTKSQSMKVLCINANNVIMKQDNRVLSPNTLSQYMKGGNIRVRFVTRNIHQRGHYMLTKNLLIKDEGDKDTKLVPDIFCATDINKHTHILFLFLEL